MSDYEGMLAELVRYPGHNGDLIRSYYARPMGAGPYPGVVVIHHAPGWDEWCHEVARKFAHHGYSAVLPDLYSRAGPGEVDDIAAKVRASGGVPDDQMLGDVQASIAFLKAQPNHNGKIGVIGFCSGGRHTFLVACRGKDVDAAVDCWGGGVGEEPPRLTPQQPVPALDYAPSLSCPLLGIFGEDDPRPSPADVTRTDARLKELGKTYEFHSYPGAGHGFFNTAGAGYRQAQAVDGWKKVFDWYGKYLR